MFVQYRLHYLQWVQTIIISLIIH